METPLTPQELNLKERLVAQAEKQNLRAAFVGRRHYTTIVVFCAAVGLGLAVAGAAFSVSLGGIDLLYTTSGTANQPPPRARGRAAVPTPQPTPREFDRLARGRHTAAIDMAIDAARSSFKPAEVARLAARSERLLTLEPRLRFLAGVRSAGGKRASAPGEAGLAEIANGSERDSLRLDSDRRLPQITIFADGSECGGHALEIIEDLKRRGVSGRRIDPISGRRAAPGKFEVRYAFDNRAFATRVANHLANALRKTLKGRRPMIGIQRVGEEDIFGGRPGCIEVRFPAPDPAAP